MARDILPPRGQHRLPMRLVLWLLLAMVLVGNSGCAAFNCTPLEDYVGGDTDLIGFSYLIADDLTTTAMPPLLPRHPDLPVLVTTFVDNNDLSQTSRFGRIMQEHISSRLVQQGYTVKEIKLTGKLQIEPGSGESILSRELAHLSPSLATQAILVGTISYTNRTMYVSARLLNPANSLVISSNDYRLCMDDTMLAMFGLARQRSPEAIQEPARPRLNSILY